MYFVLQHFLVLLQISGHVCPAVPPALDMQGPLFLQLFDPEN